MLRSFSASVQVACVVPGLPVQLAALGGGGVGAGAGVPQQPLHVDGAGALGSAGAGRGHMVPNIVPRVRGRGGRAGVCRGAGARVPHVPPNSGGFLRCNLPVAVGQDWIERLPSNRLVVSRLAPAQLHRLGIHSHDTRLGQWVLADVLQIQSGAAVPRTQHPCQPTTVWWVVDQHVPSVTWDA